MSNVIIADSHEIVRAGIAHRLVKDCGAKIVGEADDGYSTLKIVRNQPADILFLDLGIKRPSGMETLRKLRVIQPDLRIIVLSSDTSMVDAFTTFGLGAVGFVPKQESGDHFVGALRAVEMGYTFLPSEFVSEFVVLRRNVSRSGNVFGLSPRELEVLEASADGASTKEVAHQLAISVRTVETHRNSIYRKTDCKDLNALTQEVL